MRLFNILMKIVEKLNFPVYKTFTFYNGWGSYQNSLTAVKIGDLLFFTGALNSGTKTAYTKILDLPAGLSNDNTIQYITAHSWSAPTPGYMLRVLNNSIVVDNNFNIPENIGNLYISGIICLSGGGVLHSRQERAVAA